MKAQLNKSMDVRLKQLLSCSACVVSSTLPLAGFAHVISIVMPLNLLLVTHHLEWRTK